MLIEKHIHYSELRCFSENVMSFVRNETLVYNITLSSRIETDCRITGDDIDELLWRFSEKFGVNLSDLTFKKHFHTEGEGAAFLPFAPLIVATKLAIELLDVLARRILKFDFKHKLNAFLEHIFPNSKKDLMVKDLVTSAIFKRFQLKNEIVFVLSK